jgi:hypothetical protein
MIVVSARLHAYALSVGEYARIPVIRGGCLELRGPAEARVHLLSDSPLQRGDEVELLLADGYWLRGRYDWSGLEARWAALRVELGGPWQERADELYRPMAVLALHPEAILRWPSSR